MRVYLGAMARAKGVEVTDRDFARVGRLSWSPVASGEAYSLNDVRGASAGNVYALGTGGTILHWDGAAWCLEPSGTDAALNAVSGEPGARVWALGERGVVLRYEL
jgi:hypothetical protein